MAQRVDRRFAGLVGQTFQSVNHYGFAQELFPQCEMRPNSVLVPEVYLVVGRRIQNRKWTGVPARAARVGWWMRPGRTCDKQHLHFMDR